MHCNTELMAVANEM